MSQTAVSIVDDHSMISNAISNMISENPNYKVLDISRNGEEFIEYIKSSTEKPEIVLMDVNMPIMDGIKTTEWISSHEPDMKVIALTMQDDEQVIIKMLKAGAKGYLLKDMHPDILFEALETVHKKGVFYTDIVTNSLLKFKHDNENEEDEQNDLKERELEFIQLACSEKTYKEIAEDMCLSPKTVDNYRDSVFVKLNVKSRVGLVLYAIKNKLYKELNT